jgi:hypothetical protein
VKHAVLLLVLAVAAYLWLRYRGPGRTSSAHRPRVHRPGGGRPVQGAGASADAHARELRTPLVRLATAAGIPTRAEARARRFEIGAQGERQVAALLAPLTREGWVFLADCALPRGEANVDLVAIGPRGLVAVVDAKKYERFRLRVSGNRLLYGKQDVSGRMRGLLYEASTVSNLLCVPVAPVAAVVGPMLRGTQLRFRGIRLVPAEDAADILRGLDRQHLTTIPASRLADTARRLLPPKTER